MTNNSNVFNLNSDYIVTPDMGANKNVGLQVFWRLSGVLDKEAVDEALAKALPDGCLPAASNSQKYLRRALDVVRGSHNLVRKMARNDGFSIVEEDENKLDLEAAELAGVRADAYDVTLNVKVVKDFAGQDTLKITPANHPQADQLREEFKRQQLLYHAGLDISQFLSIKVMKLVHGLSVRDRGGIYYLPPGEDCERMKAVAEALHSVSTFDAAGRVLSGCKMYLVPVIFSDNLADAVTDSLLEECDSLTSDVMDKINEDDLKMRGWAGQRRIVLEQANKIEKFQSALGIGMGHLTAKLDELLAAIGTAEMKLAYDMEHPEESV